MRRKVSPRSWSASGEGFERGGQRVVENVGFDEVGGLEQRVALAHVGVEVLIQVAEEAAVEGVAAEVVEQVAAAVFGVPEVPDLLAEGFVRQGNRRRGG
ncbi:MAG: hypothetical protein R3F65_25540 [bacterium]